MTNISPPLTTFVHVLNDQPRVLEAQVYIPYSAEWAGRGRLATSESFGFFRPSGEYWRLVDPWSQEVVARLVTGREPQQNLVATYDDFHDNPRPYNPLHTGGTTFIQFPGARGLYPNSCRSGT
jgi:hypothetical protein